MINSNPLKFFKDLKKPVTNYLVEQADKFPVNNKVWGNYLRAFHLAAPVNMMLLALYIPKNLFIILYILLCGAFFCFVMWDGCFITRVEKILIGDNITFIDPCLEIINMPLTSKNRMNGTDKEIVKNQVHSATDDSNKRVADKIQNQEKEK